MLLRDRTASRRRRTGARRATRARASTAASLSRVPPPASAAASRFSNLRPSSPPPRVASGLVSASSPAPKSPPRTRRPSPADRALARSASHAQRRRHWSAPCARCRRCPSSAPAARSRRPRRPAPATPRPDSPRHGNVVERRSSSRFISSSGGPSSSPVSHIRCSLGDADDQRATARSAAPPWTIALASHAAQGKASSQRGQPASATAPRRRPSAGGGIARRGDRRRSRASGRQRGKPALRERGGLSRRRPADASGMFRGIRRPTRIIARRQHHRTADSGETADECRRHCRSLAVESADRA